MAFNLEEFFFNTPIYTKIEIEEGDYESEDFDLLFERYAEQRDIEGYNPWKKVTSTFNIVHTLGFDNSSFKRDGGLGTVRIRCKRYSSEFRFFIAWNSVEKKLFKVGQYPSVADFHVAEIKKYKKVISDEKLKEFTRAIGLAANGVGIGSFVYLRRIFEFLITEAAQYAIDNGVITVEEFRGAKMDKKIDLLHTYLPEFLVENKGIYSVLSIGIHALDEQTCLAHFDTLRVGIEIILDEKLEVMARNEKIGIAKKKLASLKGQLKQ